MATTSIFDGTAPDEVGSDTGGTNGNASGKVVWSQVKDGIDGTVETSFDARLQPQTTTSFTDSAGNTWTLNGNAAIVSGRTFTVSVKRRTSRRDNIVDYDNDGVDQPVNGLVTVGEGEGEAKHIVYIQALQGTTPLWEDRYTVSTDSDEEALIARGTLELSRRASSAVQYMVELDPSLPPTHLDCIPGARARLVIADGYVQVDQEFWIGKKEVVLSKEQDEQIRLELTQ